MSARFATLTLLLAAACATAPPRRPNVLFVAVDDMNNDLGAYGHPQVKSPNIDRLAARGVRFDRAYTQLPFCSPSRSSLMTGLRPQRTRVFDLRYHFRTGLPHVVTLPQLFMKHGYFAARVGKIYHYANPEHIGTSGLDDPPSWHKVVNPRGRDKDEEHLITNHTPDRGLGSSLSMLAAGGVDDEQTDGKVAIEAIKLMEENRGRPFFVAAGFYRPHCPYVAPKKYFDLYPLDAVSVPRVTREMVVNVPAAALASTQPWPFLGATEQQAREARRAYYAAITFVDAQVGKLLDALDRLALADKTIVVFWSDHGYNLGEHGLWMKQSLFETAARVPLVFAGPGVTARGRGSPRTVELVDIYPTLADLAGLAPPTDLDGASLRPLLENPTAPWERPAFTETKRKGSFGLSVRTERWRYTEWGRGKDGVELYDHESDPDELRNLVQDPTHGAIITSLKRLVDTHWPEGYAPGQGRSSDSPREREAGAGSTSTAVSGESVAK